MKAFASAILTLLAALPVFAGDPIEGEWDPLHPEGDTPAERMLSLAYTDALPRFNRAELYAIVLPKPSKRIRQAGADTFPVRPYRAYARVLARNTIEGTECEQIGASWRTLRFDRWGGAMCHVPAYGMRLYRDDQLLFETSICWDCSNFYRPSYDPKSGKLTHTWYGFRKDENSSKLLKCSSDCCPTPTCRS